MRPIDGDEVLGLIEDILEECKEFCDFETYYEGGKQAAMEIKAFIEGLPVLTTALDYMDDGR